MACAGRRPRWRGFVAVPLAVSAVWMGTPGQEAPVPSAPIAWAPDPWRLPPEGEGVTGRAIPASTADLADDDLVIGVTVDGRSRAYPVRAFWSGSHVVNDVLEGVPVTVTHCNLQGSTRVFTGDGDQPLAVSTAGYMNGLILDACGQWYRQDSQEPAWETVTGPFPFAAMSYEVVTWSAWRAAHPDTDVARP